MIEIQRGNAQAALAAAQQEIPGVWQYVAMALARQVGSDRSAADAALKALIDLDAEGAPYQIAEVYALHNDPDETFVWLDRACSRDAGIGYRLYDLFILRCKDDPRLPPRFAKRCVCQRRLKLASEPESLRLLPTFRRVSMRCEMPVGRGAAMHRVWSWRSPGTHQNNLGRH